MPDRPMERVRELVREAERITYQATPITVKQEIATIIHIHQFDDSDIVVIFNLMILEEDLEGS